MRKFSFLSIVFFLGVLSFNAFSIRPEQKENGRSPAVLPGIEIVPTKAEIEESRRNKHFENTKNKELKAEVITLALLLLTLPIFNYFFLKSIYESDKISKKEKSEKTTKDDLTKVG